MIAHDKPTNVAGSVAGWVDRVATLPRPLLLAFDVDGTLAPIVADASKARVPVVVQRALARLGALPGVQLAVITGRDYGPLRTMLPIANSYRAMEHGAVLLGPGDVRRPGLPAPALQAKLERFEAWVRDHAVPHGAELERKRASRAIHVRTLLATNPTLAEGLLHEAKRVALTVGLRPREGRALIEAELAAADKGQALRRIVRRSGARGVFFAGDDFTDMSALSQAVELGGVGLFVRSDERPQAPDGVSGAVEGPEDMAALVCGLAQRLCRRGAR